MNRALIRTFVLSLTLLLFPANGFADQFYDSMTNATESGGLGGSLPDGSPGATQTWTSYWLQGGAYWLQYPTDGAYDTLTAPRATYPSTDLGGEVGTPQRGPTGTTFTLSVWNNFNSGATIPVNPSRAGLITAQATVNFGSIVGGWAAIGLDPNIAASPPYPADLYNNQGGIEMIVRPVSNGMDYAEFFINTYPTSTPGNFGTQVGSLISIPASDNGTWGLTHTIAITVNPANGAVASYVDGTLFASGTLTFANLTSFDTPPDMGLVLSTRDSMGGSTMNATYSAVSVTVAPEPAGVGMIGAAGTIFCLRPRKRP